MARIRTIKPEFWKSQKIGKLTFGARLLFVAMWNDADDRGRVRGDPVYLGAWAFPYDALGRNTVLGYLYELVNLKLLRPYEHDECMFFEVVNWHEHQTINRPAKSGYLPEPTDKTPDLFSEHSVSTHVSLSEDSVSTHGAFSEHSVSTHANVFRERKGREGKGSIGSRFARSSCRLSQADDSPAPDEQPEEPNVTLQNETPEKPKKRRTKRKLTPTEDEQAVFVHWCTVHGKKSSTAFSDERIKAVRDRFESGFNLEDICKGIEGCAQCPHNMGSNSNRRKYNDLELICRNDTQLQKFIDVIDDPPTKTGNRYDSSGKPEQIIVQGWKVGFTKDGKPMNLDADPNNLFELASLPDEVKAEALRLRDERSG